MNKLNYEFRPPKSNLLSVDHFSKVDEAENEDNSQVVLDENEGKLTTERHLQEQDSQLQRLDSENNDMSNQQEQQQREKILE